MVTIKSPYQVGDYVAVECGGQIVFIEVRQMTWDTDDGFTYGLKFPIFDVEERLFKDCELIIFDKKHIIGRLNPSAVAKFRKPVVEEPPKKRGRKPKVAITMDTEPEQAEIPADAPD